MDIEKVKAAFIKADDLAQQGDKQAAEDAAEFARVIKSYKGPEKEEVDNTSLKQIGKNALGGLTSAGDFLLGMGSLPLAGIAGIVGGAQDVATGKGDFLSGATRRIEEFSNMFNMGDKLGISDNPGYQAGNKALGVPGEMGKEAARGIGALGRLPFEGVEGAVQHITNPEQTPYSSTAEDVLGTFLGYGMAGKMVENAVTPRPNLRPQNVPIAERGFINEQQRPPAAQHDAMPFSKDPMAIVPDIPAETGKGSFVRNNRTGEPMPFPREEVMPPLEMDPSAPYRGQNMDVDTASMSNMGKGRFMEGAELPPDAIREGGPAVERTQDLADRNIQSDMQRTQEEQNKAAADWEARKREFGEDPPLRSAQEMSIPYDPFSLKDELTKVPEDWQVRDEIERGREHFPTMDIDLLPEAVAKDSVIKGQLTKYNKIVEQINALKDKARDVAIEGERIKNEDVGRTKKSQEEVAQIKVQMDALQKKADVINNQLYNRLSNKHGVKEPGMKLFRGREAEHSVTPDMQRSPDAKITNSGPIQKTGKHPLGGVGKKQGGALDVSAIGEELGKLIKGGRDAGKAVVSSLSNIDHNEPKRTKLPHSDLIRSLTGADSRDPVTFAKEVLKDKDSLVDIDDNVSMKGLVRKDLPAAAVGKLNYKLNPITSYVSHVLDKIDGATKVAKEVAVWGKTAANTRWRKLPYLVKSDSGARTIASTFSTRADKEVFRESTMKYADGKVLKEMGLDSPTDAMLAADGMTKRMIEAYRAVEKQFDKVIQEANKLGANITKLPGYFPAIWMGDYRVFVKDAQGNVVQTMAFDHPFQVDRFIKESSKKLPDHKFEKADASDNKYALNDLSAFQIAAQIFPADTTVGKILDNVRNDIVKHRGFRTKALERKGAKGYLGSEKGSFNDMQKAVDIYLEQAYNFISDLQKRRAVEDITKAFKEEGYSIAEHLPNTNQYMHDMVANSIGAMDNGLKQADAVLEYIGEWSGRNLKIGGKSTAKHTIRSLNGLASLFNLFTGKQFLLNAMQPVFAIPKAMQLASKLDTNGVTASFLGAYKEAFVPGQLSKDSRAALEYARNSGMIDARTLELIGSNTGKARSLIMKGTGHMASWWEQEVVRVPAYLLFNRLLAKEKMTAKERYEAAAQMTADYMVNYSKTQTPSFYGRWGLLGEAARPYQQFTHNYHGQLLEYTQEVANNKELRPLASFMAMQWTLGGLRGLLPIGAAGLGAAAYIYKLASQNDDPVPTAEEMLMGSGASDLFVFGPTSKLTGVNVSTSGAAPNILPTPGFPGVGLAASLIKDVGGYGMKALAGNDTSADRMKAAMTATPSIGKGLVEEQFALPDGSLPNPNRGMQSDLGRPRTDTEWKIKNLLGAEPTSEGIAKGRIRAMDSYKKSLTEKQKVLLDKVVDDIMVGRRANMEKFKEFANVGGDPTKLQPAIISEVKKRLLSRVEAELVNGSNFNKAQAHKMMEKYQVQINGMSTEQLDEVIKQINQ